MSGSLDKVDAITMFIDDVARSKNFYSTLFAREPVYEDDNAVAFQLENIIVNLLRVPDAARELIEPAEVGARDAGARFVLTLPVENVDEAVGMLRNFGIELLNGPMDRPWGIRTASFQDPDGHIWELAHNLSG